MPFLERQYAGSPHQAGVADTQIFSSTPLSERTVQAIDFGTDVFTPPRTIRWTGDIAFPQTGVYRWNFYAVGGIRFWIDDRLIIDRWTNTGTLSHQVEETVQTGTHSLRVEYTFTGTSRITMAQNFVRASTPTETPSIPTTPTGSVPTVPPPSTGAPQVDLATIVQFSQNGIDRTYARRSLVPPAPETFNIRNTSNVIDLNVTFNSVPSVVFTPASFALPKQASQAVTATFVPSVFETYADGVTTINATIALSALNTPVTPIEPTSSVEPPPNYPPTSPIVVSPPLIQFRRDQTATVTATRNGVPVEVNWAIYPDSARNMIRINNTALLPFFPYMTAGAYSSITLSASSVGSCIIAAILGAEIVQTPVIVTTGVIQPDIPISIDPVEPEIIVIAPEIPSIPGPQYTSSVNPPPIVPDTPTVIPPPPAEPITGGTPSRPDETNPLITITDLGLL